MANYKLEYSQIVRRKLKSLRAYLKAEYGEEVSKKSIKLGFGYDGREKDISINCS